MISACGLSVHTSSGWLNIQLMNTICFFLFIWFQDLKYQRSISNLIKDLFMFFFKETVFFLCFFFFSFLFLNTFSASWTSDRLRFSSTSVWLTEEATGRQHTIVTLIGSSFKILTTSLWFSPSKEISFTSRNEECTVFSRSTMNKHEKKTKTEKHKLIIWLF